MKYIKTFENVNLNYKVGDYAIFNYDNVDYAHNVRMTDDLRTFLNNNAGEIITISIPELPWIEVRYDDIPDNIQYKFHSNNTILLWKDMIVATSSDSEDLEAYKQTKKYNL